MISKDQQLLCDRLQVSFSQPELLQKALTHRSASNNNNERLEYLGDAILNFIIAAMLFSMFPKAREGQLSRLRASLVQGVTLADIARDLKLSEVLILGTGELKSGGYRRDSILANTFEALIGALYLDSGLEVVKATILRLFNTRLQAIDINKVIKDPKTRLQEYLQSKQQALPIYSVREVKNNGKAFVFEASCQIALLDEKVVAQGTSRRKAEQKVAAHILTLLEKK